MKFQPTEDQIRLAEAVLTAMAHEDLIRPIVENYEHEILKKHQFRIDRKWVEHGCEDKIILDRKDVFALSSEDAKVYFAECFAARDASKLKVDNPEFCPLCVAESLRIQAEAALLKSMAATPGLEALATGSLYGDKRKMAIDLTLRMLAPFCGEADEILHRYANA